MTTAVGETQVRKAETCEDCGKGLVGEVCVNPDCKEAQIVATAGAGRETAKATARTGQGSVAQPEAPAQPRSYASSGRPD